MLVNFASGHTTSAFAAAVMLIWIRTRLLWSYRITKPLWRFNRQVQFRSVAGLKRTMAAESEDRFAAYVEALSAALGHAVRRGPFKGYCLGLLMPIERKSVEPFAAITTPG